MTVCWLGDSRAYWLARPRPAGPGAHHGRLVARGDGRGRLLSEADALASPQAHVVTGWLGADSATLRAARGEVRAARPGVLLLCSDGLWNYEPDAARAGRARCPRR